MRTRPILALAATAALVPAFLSAQDAEHAQHVAQAAPELPVHQNEYVTIENHVDDRMVDYLIGPLDLPADMGHLRLPIQMAEIPVDGWLHGFAVAMLDADGHDLPMDLLHHVNFIDPDKRDVFAPIARRVIAAGRETAEKELPGILGYPVQTGDRMIISTMFANPVGTDFAEAYLRVRLTYSLEEDGFMQPRDVYPFYLDVMGPVGAKDFPVPPGKTVLSYEASPVIEGRILGIGGHLHDYATLLRLEDVTDGEVIWEAEPEYTEDGRLVGVPEGQLWKKGGVKVSPDHVYRIYVEYDNPMAHPTPDGGMGEIGGVIWASKDVVWPEFNREDPVYVADLINTLEAPEKLGGHGHGEHGGQGEMEGMDDGAMEGMDHDAMQHEHDGR
jgi:hypothetical protein